MTVAEPVPSAVTSRIPLSVQQEFLCLWDKGDEMGPFGPRYHIIDGWHITGELDLDALRVALERVVERHEALRTNVVRDPGNRYQEILPPTAPELELRDLRGSDRAERELAAEELLNELAAGTFSVRSNPSLKAVLGRFDQQHSVLCLIAHHTAADAWSMQLIMRDLTTCYAEERGVNVPALPHAAQYRDYALWQREDLEAGASPINRAFWRDRLAGAQALALPTDRLRSEHSDFATAWYRFTYGKELGEALRRITGPMRSSPFMVLLAAFALFVNEATGATDIVVPTFTPGRNQARFQDAVGSFFNCLPLRVDIQGAETFREIVTRTRTACLKSYSREIPLAQILDEVPDLMGPVTVDGLAGCVFQVIQTPHMMDQERVGELVYSAIRRRVLSQEIGSDIPDGILFCLELDPTGDLIGEFGYSTNLYNGETARRMVEDYRRTLANAAADPDKPLNLR